MISVVLLPLWTNPSAVRQSHWSCLRLIQHQKTLRFISQSLPSHPLGSYLTSAFNTSTWGKPAPSIIYTFHQTYWSSKGAVPVAIGSLECVLLQNAGAHWTFEIWPSFWGSEEGLHLLHMHAGWSERWGGAGVWRLEAGLSAYADLEHNL